MYLNAEAVNATLEFVAQRSAAGSSIIFDYALASVIDGTFPEPPAVEATRLKQFERFGEPWLFGIAQGSAKEFVERRGFELVSDLGLRELFQKYLSPGMATTVLGKSSGRTRIAHARVPD